MKLLRDAGISVCAIVDFDILNSEQVLGEILEALSGKSCPAVVRTLRNNVAKFVENISEEQLIANLRSSVDEWRTATYGDLRHARRTLEGIAQRASKWDAVKVRGISFFDDGPRADVERLVEISRNLGLFIVVKGELESWLSLGVSKSREWNRRALEALNQGNCPVDLRDFVGSAVSFLWSLRQ